MNKSNTFSTPPSEVQPTEDTPEAPCPLISAVSLCSFTCSDLGSDPEDKSLLVDCIWPNWMQNSLEVKYDCIETNYTYNETIDIGKLSVRRK